MSQTSPHPAAALALMILETIAAELIEIRQTADIKAIFRAEARMRAYVSAARGAAAVSKLTDAPPLTTELDPDDPDNQPAPYTWGELQARIHERLAEIQEEIDRGEREEDEGRAGDGASLYDPPLPGYSGDHDPSPPAGEGNRASSGPRIRML